MLYVTGVEPLPPLLFPPQAASPIRSRQAIGSQGKRRCLRDVPPISRSPASGRNAAKIGMPLDHPFDPGLADLSAAAAVAGTVTASEKGTLLPGVMEVGENVQAAPEGKVLCRHDSVMG